jgi:hypothetical protein
VLRFPAPVEGTEAKRMPDLGPGIRGGKAAYWLTFMKDEDWTIRLIEVLGQLGDMA